MTCVVDSGSEASMTSLGTPLPSAHQLLQPALSARLLPLPPACPLLYSLVTSLREHAAAVTVLQRLRETHPAKEDLLSASIERLNDWKVNHNCCAELYDSKTVMLRLHNINKDVHLMILSN